MKGNAYEFIRELVPLYKGLTDLIEKYDEDGEQEANFYFDFSFSTNVGVYVSTSRIYHVAEKLGKEVIVEYIGEDGYENCKFYYEGLEICGLGKKVDVCDK